MVSLTGFASLVAILLWNRVAGFVSPMGRPHCARISETKREAVDFNSVQDAFNGVNMGMVSVGGADLEIKYIAAALIALILPSQVLVPKQLVDSNRLAAIVDGTFLATKDIQCVYKGSRDGWSAIDFHNKVDGRGSAVVVCRTRTGKTFGGYNPTGWRSTDDYYDSSAAFLWCNSGGGVTKFDVMAGGSAAIFDYATGGPCFGSADMLIGPPRAAIMGGFAGPDMENTSTNAGDLRQAKVTPGMTYNVDTKWPVFGSPSLLEVEVYCNVGIGQQKATW